MKALPFILSMCIISCSIVACGNHNNPEELDEKEKQQMTERAQELATFLTDNYSEGDSVYFTHTNLSANESNREGFVVTLCEFRKLEYEETPETFLQEVNVVFVGYMLVASLRSDENDFVVVISHVIHNGDVYTNNTFEINHHSEIAEWEMIEKETEINLLHCDTYCTLQKNVGIVLFGNKDEKWELLQ